LLTVACAAKRQQALEEAKAAGAFSPPSKARTGPASSGRLVCAPGAMALSLYRRPTQKRRQTMSLIKLCKSWLGRTANGSTLRSAAPRKPRLRLTVEPLEDRALPSSYTAGTVPELVAAINAANQSAEADTIALVAGRTFTLTEVNNSTNGATGLPTIAANGGKLTIVGNSDIIERSTAAGTPAFRLFDVAAGASLTVENVTLQGGLAGPAFGSGSSAQGGALRSNGSLILIGVTVQNNLAQSALDSNCAMGGGIYSGGSLTMQGGRIQNNQALGWPSAFGGGLYVAGSATLTDVIVSSNSARGLDGGPGGNGGPEPPGAGQPGGHALGGGLFVANYYTTISLSGVTLVSNTAQGGRGGDKGAGYRAGDGGNGLGGGLYAENYTTVTMRTSVVSQNSAQGGAAGKGSGGNRGRGVGGGLHFDGSVDSPAVVRLDAFTVAHVKGNKASTSAPNIYGSYTIGW
jgi:hypothetical protein